MPCNPEPAVLDDSCSRMGSKLKDASLWDPGGAGVDLLLVATMEISQVVAPPLAVVAAAGWWACAAMKDGTMAKALNTAPSHSPTWMASRVGRRWRSLS